MNPLNNDERRTNYKLLHILTTVQQQIMRVNKTAGFFFKRKCDLSSTETESFKPKISKVYYIDQFCY